MLKEIMPPGGEIKLGKMGSKIRCVILHETLSKFNVATIHIQLHVFTEKHYSHSNLLPPITCVRP